MTGNPEKQRTFMEGGGARSDGPSTLEIRGPKLHFFVKKLAKFSEEPGWRGGKERPNLAGLGTGGFESADSKGTAIH